MPDRVLATLVAIVLLALVTLGYVLFPRREQPASPTAPPPASSTTQ